MPRSPIIQYPNAFYHVMNRGRNKDLIFRDNSDFKVFLDIISQANIKFNAIIHAYCLMNNHYHLLLETPNANISQIMHSIGREYVQKYNEKYSCDGPLFKSRYKAILIDEDSYLISLNRYIHRNPICLKNEIKDYRWSSYQYYLGAINIPKWLNVSKTMRVIGYDVDKYKKFVETKSDREIYDEKRCNMPSILGEKGFKRKIIDTFRK